VSDIFRGFSGSQKPVSKAKDGIAITLIKNLKGCPVTGRRLCQQPFICYLIRQSKRSIL
jgi:hypothetical protein